MNVFRYIQVVPIACLLGLTLSSCPVSKAKAAASIVPAFANFSCLSGTTCIGPALNAGKQGTNSAYVGGTGGIALSLSKTSGADKISIGVDSTVAHQTDIASAVSAITNKVFSNASTASTTVSIGAYNSVTVCKTDHSEHTVTISDSTPRLILADPLSLQGECVNLVLSSSTWYIR